MMIPATRKKKGISGRSSNVVIQKRLKIGKSLLIRKSFKTNNEFFKAYKAKLMEKGLPIPSDRILIDDLSKAKEMLQKYGIDFDHLEKKSQFSPLGSSMKGKITNVNVSVNGYEYILYDEQHKILLKDYTKFKAPFLRLYKKYAKRLITTKTKLKHYPMVHLYIVTQNIPNKDYIALNTSIIESFLKYNEHEILYASAHCNCAEIVFYKKNYNMILFNTYCLVKSSCI